MGAVAKSCPFGHPWTRSGSDLGEADQRDRLVRRDFAVVELSEEGGEFLRAAYLRIVVLDVARGELAESLHLDLVDDGVEDLVPGAVARADEHSHDHSLLVLTGLVSEPNGRRLAAAAELVGHDR